MVQRYEAAEHWLLPDRQSDSVTVLQCETSFLIGEAEFLGFWPQLDNFRRRDAGPDHVDRGIQVIAAALVSIHQCWRRAPDGKGPVVARPVAHISVNQVE